MIESRWTVLAAFTLCGIVLILACGDAAEPAKRVGPDPRQWDQTVGKAVAYLKTTQADDGSWSSNQSPGVTGIVLTGMLQTGTVTAKDQVAERALKYITSLVNPKAGHIAGKDPRPQLLNYVTSVNVMALHAANRDDYKQVIDDGVKFLKKLQWDEERGKDRKNDFYGGAGYDSKSRPDLSNLQMALDAWKAVGIPSNDPNVQKALIFLGRCQNIREKEYNDQPWADKINDGSFIYTAAGGGESKAGELPGGGLPGYGSMTYAGIKSMIYCGVPRTDPRIEKAYAWITKHYSVEENPGMPPGRKQWGLYYYYHTMAKCLDAMGVDEVIDADGKAHDWRAEITAALAKRQQPDGSWLNKDDRWMEANPNLVTGYALMAPSHCKPKGK